MIWYTFEHTLDGVPMCVQGVSKEVLVSGMYDMGTTSW